MEELKGHFTQGVDYKIVYDTTPFINESINEVFMTLRDAVLLVAFVVLLFLQNWRSAIIPLVAVPVAIIGTFAVMAGMGFSLNNLTLFGLVLAIGIVVDDAIVVVEAIQRQVDEGLAPREAAMKAMSLVSGPVIAVGLVLSAVFVPCAFITGITGQFFRQFALTIAVSTLISAFNSLTLSPALGAILLRQKAEGAEYDEVLPPAAFPLVGGWLGYEYLAPPLARAFARWLTLSPWIVPVATAVAAALLAWTFRQPLNRTLARIFRLFNVGFDHSTNVYTRSVGGLLRVSVLVLVVYGGLLLLTWWGFTKSPSGFIPAQDKGYLLVNVQLPDAASVERTERVMHRIEELARKNPGVKNTVAIAGQSILLGANAPNFGAMYVMLDDFHRRAARGLSGETIAAQLQADFQQEIKDGLVNVLGAPPIDGLGTAGASRSSSRIAATTGCRRCRRWVRESSTTPAGFPRSRGSSAASAPTLPGSPWTSTAPRPRSKACRWLRSSRLSRTTRARSTSTTSTATAAPGRSTCRPTPATASRWTTSSN
jgi:multidrug efflux pump subunit AcrB